jgi:hypothetical protein
LVIGGGPAGSEPRRKSGISAAWAPLAAPSTIANRKNLRIATLRSNTLNLCRSSLVNLNQSLSRHCFALLFSDKSQKQNGAGKIPRRY